jgi:S1-C subfamily serine protease
MRDADKTPYPGFASAGFFWTTLVAPAKRSYLDVKAPGKGILVLSCVPGTGAAESIKPNDVILEWDGHAVDNLGYYEDEDFGRLAVSYLIKGRRVPGETIPVRVVRDQKEILLQLRLGHQNDRDALVPENVLGAPTEYLVEGGFVITELTGRYLRAHGADWERTVDPRIVHTYLANKHAAATPGEHVVILAGILPDPINIGYQQRFRNEIITAVNGQSVSNMTDVFRIVDKDGSLRRFTLKSVGVDLVVDQEELAVANARLARQYRIPALRFQEKHAKQP